MLYEELNKEIVANMKTKNMVDLTILRTLKADISKIAIDAKKEITDEMVIDVITKSVKQFSDALEIYTKSNMNDHIAETKHKIEVISKYLPAQMTEDEVIALVNEVKTRIGAVTKKDMGKMMKELTPKTRGKFDSKKLSRIVNGVLE
jgi:uncharacterized protein